MIVGVFSNRKDAEKSHIEMIKERLEPMTFSDVQEISDSIQEDEESVMDYVYSDDMKYYFKETLTYED